ncbi:MAG: hypothetical protein UR12_C0006G0016 [candidate division TM6 bacterium GW2011_GWF2_30_66]|nr:MAG: hypothetical protein UR12_C0006G0016 [candidate division TM6 bacterium GW2011_GWF2_30_66]
MKVKFIGTDCPWLSKEKIYNVYAFFSGAYLICDDDLFCGSESLFEIVSGSLEDLQPSLDDGIFGYKEFANNCKHRDGLLAGDDNDFEIFLKAKKQIDILESNR